MIALELMSEATSTAPDSVKSRVSFSKKGISHIWLTTVSTSWLHHETAPRPEEIDHSSKFEHDTRHRPWPDFCSSFIGCKPHSPAQWLEPANENFCGELDRERSPHRQGRTRGSLPPLPSVRGMNQGDLCFVETWRRESLDRTGQRPGDHRRKKPSPVVEKDTYKDSLGGHA